MGCARTPWRCLHQLNTQMFWIYVVGGVDAYARTLRHHLHLPTHGCFIHVFQSLKLINMYGVPDLPRRNYHRSSASTCISGYKFAHLTSNSNGCLVVGFHQTTVQTRVRFLANALNDTHFTFHFSSLPGFWNDFLFSPHACILPRSDSFQRFSLPLFRPISKCCYTCFKGVLKTTTQCLCVRQTPPMPSPLAVSQMLWTRL